MSLNSFEFVLSFAFLYTGLLLIEIFSKIWEYAKRFQIVVLLVFSYYFILKSDWRFCLCIAFVTIISYYSAIYFEKTNNPIVIRGGVIVLIIVLGYFKYTNFFISSLSMIFGLDPVVLNIVLPLGISFYVFSALTYIIDVYRKEYHAEKNFLNLALFISFFPKLTAGPIVRGKDFFPQLKEYRGITYNAFITGIQIFIFGLFKKIVLADHLGVFVDDVFHAPTAFNTGTVILATVSYSLQIYFDFSGYSDMAIGISKILGFDFLPNFNLPYIARDESEFWKRWHISLSSLFQDYLYIPLGGNRRGKIRTYINLLIVMLASGLWHGAGWTFVAWGVLHGVASCINKTFSRTWKKFGIVVNVIASFIIVSLLWVVFRADSFTNAVQIWKGVFTIHSGINQPYTWSFFAIGCLIIATIAAVFHSKKIGLKDKSGELLINGFYPILDLSKFWALVVFFTFCGLTIILGYFGNTAFIYGAF